jgi:heterodisulfide reductase subunit A
MKKKIGSVLVVGAGISGIRSALDLAELGYHVTLIDRAPNIGGVLRQLDYQFPTDHCGMCKMLPLLERDSSSQYCLRKGVFHENIEILLSTELLSMTGEPGKFLVRLRSTPSVVDPDRCIGCGECSAVCPVEVPDEFNAGLTTRKAVYLPVPHNIPNQYIVDMSACTRCGECEKVCPTQAIDLQLEARRAFRILVVDDELIVRDSIKEWLEVEGFEVEMAESGFEALEKLAASRFNMMLADVKMPGMDGVELLKMAKELAPQLPVVMMTAYATVETAVDAMKIGAKHYLMKPFDPDAMVSMVVEEYHSLKPTSEAEIEVGAVVLAAGFGSFDPSSATDIYGYAQFPNVVTSIELERLLSGTGPTQGKLLRPSDGAEIKKIAWLQCIGSRNLTLDADYCSSACCMFSLKEAVLAKERSGGALDAAIFYMDMRTFGKDFQRYRERAEDIHGVRLVRSRVHTVESEGPNGAVRLQYTDISGVPKAELFDLVVLATGQRPPDGAEILAEATGIERNAWGYCRLKDFSLSGTARDGVFLSGSFSGLMDISESLIQAGSASFGASSLVQSKGGGLAEVQKEQETYRNVSRQLPRIAVALCTCGGTLRKVTNASGPAEMVAKEADVVQAIEIERLCTREGWTELQAKFSEKKPNRVLIGACLPYVYTRKLKELGEAVGLNPLLMDVVDIRSSFFVEEGIKKSQVQNKILTAVRMGLAKLRGVDPVERPARDIVQRALVVGGGIAGMTAALGIADHGFEVDLIEQGPELGGNLRSIHRTLTGNDPRDLLDTTVARVEKQAHIRVHKNARVIHSQGRLGHFITTIEKKGGEGTAIEHGVTILASGAAEAATESYSYGQCDAVLTQHELEERLHAGAVKPSDLKSVVMVQCVDSREKGAKNYCSRICCSTALKNALYLKEQNPDTDVYILYRDMMTYGFLESYYTKARRTGVVFVQYDTGDKPKVSIENGRPAISALDPILGRELVLKPDLLVLSTGIDPRGNRQIARIFGVETNEDGFLLEAEPKWRPVDSLKDGIFLCGLAHSPRSVAESIATAEAAAQRALGVLNRESVAACSLVADVRHSLCSLCERCIAACPYGARFYDEDEEKVLVDEIVCQGCGTCAATCPNSASVLRGYRDRQVLSILDAALE